MDDVSRTLGNQKTGFSLRGPFSRTSNGNVPFSPQNNPKSRNNSLLGGSAPPSDRASASKKSVDMDSKPSSGIFDSLNRLNYGMSAILRVFVVFVSVCECVDIFTTSRACRI